VKVANAIGHPIFLIIFNHHFLSVKVNDSTMMSRILALFALIASASAFVPASTSAGMFEREC
jgi:hypothetical protein